MLCRFDIFCVTTMKFLKICVVCALAGAKLYGNDLLKLDDFKFTKMIAIAFGPEKNLAGETIQSALVVDKPESDQPLTAAKFFYSFDTGLDPAKKSEDSFGLTGKSTLDDVYEALRRSNAYAQFCVTFHDLTLPGARAISTRLHKDTKVRFYEKNVAGPEREIEVVRLSADSADHKVASSSAATSDH